MSMAIQQIELNRQEDGSVAISGRELHAALHIGTRYSDWFPRMCEYGFVELEDYVEVLLKNEYNPLGGRPSTDHAMSLSMAKEICMIQRTDLGRAYRKYFLECERQLQQQSLPSYQIEDEIERAKRWIEEQAQRRQLEGEIAEMRPKAEFGDLLLKSQTNILVRDLAKLITQKGVKVGMRELFTMLRDRGFLIGGSSRDYNRPTKKAMDMGLLAYKAHVHTGNSGAVYTSYTPEVTPKGQEYFLARFLDGRLSV